MHSDTHWLLYFCFENSLLNTEQIAALASNLGFDANAENCAEKLFNMGWVTDQAFLDDAIKAAKTNAEGGFELPELPGITPTRIGISELGDFPEYSALSAMDDGALRQAVEELFVKCQQSGVSDLHLTSGARPRVRHHRKVTYWTNKALPDELARRMNYVLLTEKQRSEFETNSDLDYALTLGGDTDDSIHMRFRANLLEHKNGISGVYRIVASRLQSLEELGFPNADQIRKLLNYHNGIILVTGPVGCGKTTTLSALVNELNQTRKAHIITVEDPIEVLQDSQNSIVTQREVGQHTESFKAALKSALREDPDIIVIGEMRNLETIEMAVTAAETGHLVIATMHTRDAQSTLNRLLDAFPPRQQNQIRAMTAGSLRGILCQRLIPTVDDDVALACELMINNSAVANIIRDGKETGLESAMQTGRAHGMRTLNESLDALMAEGRVSAEVAKANRIISET